jgi:hypothetical protein
MPRCIVERKQWADRRRTVVVHQHINAPVDSANGRRYSFAVFRLTAIRWDPCHLVAGHFVNFVGRALEVFLTTRGDHNAGALSGECTRDTKTDSLAATADDRHLPF